MIKKFHTRELKNDHRFEYWHDVVCKYCVPAACEPLVSSPFNAGLTVQSFGKVAVSSMQAPLHSWRRSEHDLRTGPDEDFWLASIENGNGAIEHNGYNTSLSNGDLVFYDASKPFRFTLDARLVYLVRLPRRALLRRFPRAESLAGKLLEKSIPTVTPLRHLIQEMTNTSTYRSESISTQVGNTLLDLSALSLEVRLGDELPSKQSELYTKMYAYIKSNFEDSSITLEKLASVHHVSTRTVTRVFSRHNKTAMGVVWDTRLRAALSTIEKGKAINVTEVAISHGFTSLSHFSRAFQEKFGITPSEALVRSRR